MDQAAEPLAEAHLLYAVQKLIPAHPLHYNDFHNDQSSGYDTSEENSNCTGLASYGAILPRLAAAVFLQLQLMARTTFPAEQNRDARYSSLYIHAYIRVLGDYTTNRILCMTPGSFTQFYVVRPTVWLIFHTLS